MGFFIGNIWLNIFIKIRKTKTKNIMIGLTNNFSRYFNMHGEKTNLRWDFRLFPGTNKNILSHCSIAWFCYFLMLKLSLVELGFGTESPHLVCMNPFIVECHEKFKHFFASCCQVILKCNVLIFNLVFLKNLRKYRLDRGQLLWILLNQITFGSKLTLVRWSIKISCTSKFRT